MSEGSGAFFLKNNLLRLIHCFTLRMLLLHPQTFQRCAATVSRWHCPPTAALHSCILATAIINATSSASSTACTQVSHKLSLVQSSCSRRRHVRPSDTRHRMRRMRLLCDSANSCNQFICKSLRAHAQHCSEQTSSSRGSSARRGDGAAGATSPLTHSLSSPTERGNPNFAASQISVTIASGPQALRAAEQNSRSLCANPRGGPGSLSQFGKTQCAAGESSWR